MGQAPASATREAAYKRPPANAAVRDLQTRITAIRERIETDQRQVDMSLANSDHVYDDARRVLEIVDAETRVDAERAEKDWTARARTVTKDSPSLTARPTMDVRPSGGGLEVHVRYVTRAPDRYTTKSHLFEVVMQQQLKALP